MKTSIMKLMQESLGINTFQLGRLIQRSPYTYKIYAIPKRSGGSRTIAQPAKETKFIQHWLIENVFQKLPIHDCATAYKSGANIKANACAHKENEYLTKFDFESFFTSIKISDLSKHFFKHLGNDFSETDLNSIAKISCIKFDDEEDLCLSVGAPSSPILSNSILYEFDCKVYEWCTSRGIIYTRYADDLTFSTGKKNISNEVEPAIREIVNNLSYPTLKFNNKKTTHLSKKYQRRITGLIINNNNEVSLGRARKREISALIHQFSLNLLSEKDIFKLQGLLGFAKDIEPLFILRMSEKYTSQILESIFKMRQPPNSNY
jgi:RNA-directed DNA polymerase